MARKKNTIHTRENGDESAGPRSKSAKKRESAALQKLGENLCKLKPEARAELPLSEDLLQALAFHDSLRDKEAARRQRQYIGKLMRDADAPAIMAALERLESPHAAQMARFHAAESWREKLLTAMDIESVVEDFFRACQISPEALEKKELTSLVQRAKQAGRNDPAPKRNLFRQLLVLLAKDGK